MIMSLEQVAISLICVSVAIFIGIKKVVKIASKQWGITVLSIAGVFFLIGSTMFIRLHFIPFTSPEEAYRSVYGENPVLVIEGVESDCIVGNKKTVYLNKSEKGWNVPIINISITKGIKCVDSTTVYVSQYNFSNEYYVTVLDSENSSLEIEDNRNSMFYKSSSDDKNSCIYHTYVNKINKEYQITVNGEKIILLE